MRYKKTKENKEDEWTARRKFYFPTDVVMAVVASSWDYSPGIGALGAMTAKGIRERILVPALTEQGLNVRKSRAVIDAVVDSIKDALFRHECVELPIGSFTVNQNPEKRRSWRFGKVTVLYARRHRVDFLASAELELAVATAPPSPPPKKRKSRKKSKESKETLVKSELAISTEIIVGFVGRNVYDWKNFFKELHASSGPRPSIRAMFERARPLPDELRPLDEAARVIHECAPKEMPEDDWEHLYACIGWFARWSQRVIPTATYPEAMLEARKILLPPESIRTLDGS